MIYKLQFLTEKGTKAYKEIKAQPSKWKDRVVIKKIFREKVTSEDPLTITIKAKIPWLAIQIELDKQIIDQMKLKGCDRDLDYTMEAD